MRPLAGALLLPIALGLGACAEEPEPPPAFPTAVVTATGLPPPLYVSVTSGACDDSDSSGCEVRCAAGDAEACSRVTAEYQAAEVRSAALQVVTPRAAVQFFGPVNTVNITPPQPH